MILGRLNVPDELIRCVGAQVESDDNIWRHASVWNVRMDVWEDGTTTV